MSSEKKDGEPVGDADGLESLRERARRGVLDPIALPDEIPVTPVRLHEHAGDLALEAEQAWIGVIAGADLKFRKLIARQVVAMAAEIAGPAPTVLERLLARRVVLAWLMAHHADTLFAQRSTEWSNKQSTYALDRMDRANRRLTAAIGALATLRRLLPDDGRGGPVVIPSVAKRSTAAPAPAPVGTPEPSGSASDARPDGDPKPSTAETICFEKAREAKAANPRPKRGRRK
jgi:hypothetical protein